MLVAHFSQDEIGGALGGSHPAESLVPGSVAIYSNSGNLTNTIANYLAGITPGTVKEDHAEFKKSIEDVDASVNKMLNINGKTAPTKTTVRTI